LAKLEQQAIRQNQRSSTITRHPRVGEAEVEVLEAIEEEEPELT